MPTPVQITVTVDSSGAVSGFQQIGNSATTMGQQTSTAGLKGQAAIDALTKAWNEEQAAIAAVNARMKEHFTAQTASTTAVTQATTAFQGLTNEQTKASIAGRLLESQLGLTNRALNQVAARSATLGPLMAAALPIGIFAAVLPMVISIGEGIAHAAQAAGGMTEAMKQMNAETIQASQQAFLNPKNTAQAQRELNDVNQQIEANDKLKESVAERGKAIYAESSTLEKILGIADMRAAKEIFFNSAIDKGVALTKQQLALLEKIADLTRQAGVDQASISAESSGMHGLAKLKFDEADAIDKLEKDQSLSETQRAVKEYDVHYEFSQKRIQLEQQETDKTISLRHQVTDETLNGTAKILADEASSVDQLTRLHQRNGTDELQFQQQKVLLINRRSTKSRPMNARSRKPRRRCKMRPSLPGSRAMQRSLRAPSSAQIKNARSMRAV
jgi:hypothetical protein